jgi:hypothetical protein
MRIRPLALLGVMALPLAGGSALAQQGRQVDLPNCVNNYPRRSVMEMIFSTGPTPQANGCAPAVYSGGRFIGQDPDPNIRLQLLRNSDNEGYHLNTR